MAYDVFSTKRIAELEAKLEFANTSIDAMLIANKKLKVEIAELRKDAARYRWVLHQARLTDAIFDYTKSKERHVSNAIDAAMGEHNEQTR